MSNKCMIGDGYPSGAPHPYSGHVSELGRPETGGTMMDAVYEDMRHDWEERSERCKNLLNNLASKAQPGDTVTFVIDKDTGGMKGSKLARFDMIPPDVLWELAEHFGKGEAKYPSDENGLPNWQRGYSWRLSVAALLRHLFAFLKGEDVDPETGSSHLIAVVWHAMALRWFQLHGKGKDYRANA